MRTSSTASFSSTSRTLESIELTRFYKEHQLAEMLPEIIISLGNTILHAFDHVKPLAGYRDGVILVKFPWHFRHSTVTLTQDEEVKASFSSRVDGEQPRKRIYIERFKNDLPWAKSVFAVLYRKDVLAEDGDIINADWGVVAHLTSSMDTPEPMHPDTLIANHFKFDGGTSTQMNPEIFEAQLRESVHFWKDKVTASILKE